MPLVGWAHTSLTRTHWQLEWQFHVRLEGSWCGAALLVRGGLCLAACLAAVLVLAQL